jgi:hypothetical protein
VLLDEQHRDTGLGRDTTNHGEQSFNDERRRPMLSSSTISAIGCDVNLHARASICCSPPESRPARRFMSPASGK